MINHHLCTRRHGGQRPGFVSWCQAQVYVIRPGAHQPADHGHHYFSKSTWACTIQDLAGTLQLPTGQNVTWPSSKTADDSPLLIRIYTSLRRGGARHRLGSAETVLWAPGAGPPSTMPSGLCYGAETGARAGNLDHCFGASASCTTARRWR